MNDNDKQSAWRRFCSQLEPLGIDPYAPQVPPDDPRHCQVQAALKEYRVAIGQIVPVPPGWEGNPPPEPITNLADLASWLNDQWTSTRATEMGGEAYTADALDQATRAVRNGFRFLYWLGVQEKPERPLPAETLPVAKHHLDSLEGWVRQRIKEGWTASDDKRQPEAPPVQPTAPVKQRQRAVFADDYEANLLVHRFLSENPVAKIRQVAKGVGFSVGKVQQTEAWQREMERRSAAKKPKTKEPRPLTRTMRECIGREANLDAVDAKIDAEEAVWREIMENACPTERAKLNAMTTKERQELIRLRQAQAADELEQENGSQHGRRS